jgi:hypothetical protein
MEESGFDEIPHHLVHSEYLCGFAEAPLVQGQVVYDAQIISKHVFVIQKVSIIEDDTHILRVANSARGHMH